MAALELAFDAEIVYWRGPAPFHFMRMPEADAVALRAIASDVTYGWGVIPVTAWIGSTRWRTSLFPKDGGYLVPVRADVRRAEGLAIGDAPTVRLSVGR